MSSDDERLLELVNLVLDGEATAEEREELRATLQVSPTARETDEAIRRAVARLESLPLADPPLELRQAVVETVTPKSASVSHLRGRRRRFAFAWAAAAAALLAAFVFLQAPHVERRESRAVMAPDPSAGARIDVQRSEQGYVVEPMIPGPRPVAGRLSWDRSAAVLVAISGDPGASFSENQVEFTLRGQADRVLVVIRPVRDDSVVVQLSVRGTDIQQVIVPPK